MATQDSRIRIKRSTTPGVEPTIPASSNHLDGSWLATDLYVGEFMTNVADERVWFRASAGIVEISTSTIDAGTYTPTITNVSNVASSTPQLTRWTRIGDIVTVSGQVSIDPTAATVTGFRVSLPVASDFTDEWDLSCGALGRTSATRSINPSGGIADTTNDEAYLFFVAPDTLAISITFVFTYLVK